jgi:hypothetical protein
LENEQGEPKPPLVAVAILTLDQRIENLRKEHDRLEDKADLRKRYRQPALGALLVAVIFLYATVFLGSTLLASSKYLTYTVVTGIIAIIAFLSVIPLGKRSRRYRLKLEEKLLLPTYHAVADLGDCLKEDDPLPHYRREAENDLVELTKLLEETWTIGSYKLATLTLSAVSKFKKGMREGLIPAVAKGSREELDSCRIIMVDFGELLLKREPTLKDVESLSNQIKPLYGHSKERPWYMQLLYSARSHISLRTLIPGTISLASGWVLFNLLMLDGFAKEAALVPSVETSLGFTGIYVSWLGVQSYLKRKPVDSEA